MESGPVAITHRSTALRQGLDDEGLRRQVSARALTRIRRGSYLDSGQLEPLHREERHRAAVVAAVHAQQAVGWVSHWSAAVLWSLPTWGCDLSVVHLVKKRRNAGRRSRLIHVHGAPLAPGEQAEVDGIAVTSVARTIVDVASAAGFEAGW